MDVVVKRLFAERLAAESFDPGETTLIYTDGASRGNPGAACAACILTGNGQTLDYAEKLAPTTNNVAEYTAVLRALAIADHFRAKKLHIRSDSQLMVEQLNGNYKVKHPSLIPLCDAARALVATFASVTFEHVRREHNREADELGNRMLDGKFAENPYLSVSFVGRALPAPAALPAAAPRGDLHAEAAQLLERWQSAATPAPAAAIWAELLSLLQSHDAIKKTALKGR